MKKSKRRSNINIIIFSYTCYLGAYDYAHDISVSFGNVLMIIAGVLGLLVLLTCCLCFHPSNEKKSTNYYTRMAYYDD